VRLVQALSPAALLAPPSAGEFEQAVCDLPPVELDRYGLNHVAATIEFAPAKKSIEAPQCTEQVQPHEETALVFLRKPSGITLIHRIGPGLQPKQQPRIGVRSIPSVNSRWRALGGRCKDAWPSKNIVGMTASVTHLIHHVYR